VNTALTDFLQSIFWMGCLIDKVKRPFNGNPVQLRPPDLNNDRKIIVINFVNTTPFHNIFLIILPYSVAYI
jgi:hypothetical protein